MIVSLKWPLTKKALPLPTAGHAGEAIDDARDTDAPAESLRDLIVANAAKVQAEAEAAERKRRDEEEAEQRRQRQRREAREKAQQEQQQAEERRRQEQQQADTRRRQEQQEAEARRQQAQREAEAQQQAQAKAEQAALNAKYDAMTVKELVAAAKATFRCGTLLFSRMCNFLVRTMVL
jgi:hypothetical protein